MATTIVTKSGSGAPTASNLVAGELAVDLTNKRLYTENSSGTVLELGTNPASDVTFGDNTKAVFGDGSDLRIYHTGSHSTIENIGTGHLQIHTTDFRLKDSAGTESMILANADGNVQLYYDNALKLATTATGIDVTGSVTADGLTVDDTSGTVGLFNSTAVASTLAINNTHANAWGSNIAFRTGGTDAGYFGSIGSLLGNTDQDLSVYSTAGNGFRIYTNGNNERLRVTSAGNVGIGTSSPNAVADLHVADTSDARIWLDATSADTMELYSGTGVGMFNRSNSYLMLGTNNTERMRIDASGNLYCSGGSGGTILTLTASSGTTTGDIGRIRFGNNDIDSNLANIVGYQDGATDSGGLKFETQPTGGATTERMRIDSSGNLGIGSSLPSEKVTLAQSVPSTYTAGLSTLANPAGTHVRIENNSSVTDTFVGVTFVPTNGAAQQQLAYMGAVSTGSGLAPDIVFGRRAASTYYVESMRIDASGNLLLGKGTAGIDSSGVIIKPAGDAYVTVTAGLNTYHVYDTTNNLYTFYVGSNGGISNFSANNVNLSDEREKKNVEALPSQWDCLKHWDLKQFHYNADDDALPKKYGVIAQEIEAHCPEVIDVFKVDEDTERKGVKEQQMMWMAIKALQEAQTRIESLEARIAALES
jgi:hypothetical protein